MRTGRVRPDAGTAWPAAAACLGVAAAVLHIAGIGDSNGRYRFFAAGEAMVRAAERGSAVPAAMTVAVAAILATWSGYAPSGARRLRRPPPLRIGLRLLAPVRVARAAPGLVPQARDAAETSPASVAPSSAVVLVYGIACAVGACHVRPALSQKDAY